MEGAGAGPTGRWVVALLVALGATLGACGTPERSTPLGDGADRPVRTDGPSPTRERPEPDRSSPAPTVTAPATSAPAATPPGAPGPVALPPGRDTTVAFVVDGDTIAVGAGERVRLIGINTPETRDPRVPVECFGKEAAARTAALLPPGTPVRLAFDVERTDRYGRTLAYVYRRGDGLFLNAALVAEGYAQVATYPPNVAHADEFLRLERLARFFGSGLWSACRAPAPPPAPPPPAPAPPGPAPAPGPGRCDPAYPGVCIPPPPPDLDCADVPHRRFAVRAPDPHRFDADGDGIGCE